MLLSQQGPDGETKKKRVEGVQQLRREAQYEVRGPMSPRFYPLKHSHAMVFSSGNAMAQDLGEWLDESDGCGASPCNHAP